MIKIQYLLDNDDWTDKQYEDDQDNERIFTITKTMIKELIYENVKLPEGCYIDEVYLNN
jgi:hypothetical protein